MEIDTTRSMGKHHVLAFDSNRSFDYDVSEGAATAVWLATTDETLVGDLIGGGFWDRMTKRVATVDLMSLKMLEQFWVRWDLVEVEEQCEYQLSLRQQWLLLSKESIAKKR